MVNQFYVKLACFEPDLWYPESSVGDSEYSLSVLSKLFKAFMRYRANNVCPHEQMDKWTRRMDSPKT